jgi:hypothetical protein
MFTAFKYSLNDNSPSPSCVYAMSKRGERGERGERRKKQRGNPI